MYALAAVERWTSSAEVVTSWQPQAGSSTATPLSHLPEHFGNRALHSRTSTPLTRSLTDALVYCASRRLGSSGATEPLLSLDRPDKGGPLEAVPNRRNLERWSGKACRCWGSALSPCRRRALLAEPAGELVTQKLVVATDLGELKAEGFELLTK